MTVTWCTDICIPIYYNIMYRLSIKVSCALYVGLMFTYTCNVFVWFTGSSAAYNVCISLSTVLYMYTCTLNSMYMYIQNVDACTYTCSIYTVCIYMYVQCTCKCRCVCYDCTYNIFSPSSTDCEGICAS